MATTRTLTTVTIGLLAAGLVACGSSGGPAPQGPTYAPQPTSPTPSPVLDAKFGQSYPVVVATRPTPLTCTVTVKAPTAAKSLPDQDRLPELGWYVTFTVTFHATSEGAQPGGTFAFFVRAADGTEHTSPYYSGSNSLPNSVLHNGQNVAGTVTFDLATPHGTLAYRMAYEAGASQVEWPF